MLFSMVKGKAEDVGRMILAKQNILLAKANYRATYSQGGGDYVPSHP